MGTLTGVSFEVDSAKVHAYVVKFNSGNDTTESKIRSHTQHSNKRLDYIVLKNHFKGVGVNVVDIIQDESILEN